MSFNSTMQFVNPAGAGGGGGTNDPAYLGSQYEQTRNAYIQNLMGQQQRAAQAQYSMGGYGGQPMMQQQMQQPMPPQMQQPMPPQMQQQMPPQMQQPMPPQMQQPMQQQMPPQMPQAMPQGMPQAMPGPAQGRSSPSPRRNRMGR